jgi:hypothetical protein
VTDFIVMRNTGRTKDRREWLECGSSLFAGPAVMAIEDQIKDRKLMRICRQSSGSIMSPFCKRDPIADVLLRRLSVAV